LLCVRTAVGPSNPGPDGRRGANVSAFTAPCFFLHRRLTARRHEDARYCPTTIVKRASLSLDSRRLRSKVSRCILVVTINKVAAGVAPPQHRVAIWTPHILRIYGPAVRRKAES